MDSTNTIISVRFFCGYCAYSTVAQTQKHTSIQL